MEDKELKRLLDEYADTVYWVRQPDDIYESYCEIKDYISLKVKKAKEKGKKEGMKEVLKENN